MKKEQPQQNIKAIVSIFVIVFVLILFFIHQSRQTTYVPEVSFELSTYSINVNDNQISTDLITATVTKLDDKNIPTKFVLKFKPSNKDYVYAVDSETNEKITEKTTEILTQKGRKFQYQFKVLGKKVVGQPESPWEITIELYYNNTKMKEQTLNVVVK